VGLRSGPLALSGGSEHRSLQAHQQVRTQDQLPPALNALRISQAVVRPAQLILGLLEAVFDGLFTHDKFCLSRFGQLSLTWWRYPLRLRGRHSDAQTVSPGEVAHQGGSDETAMARSPADVRPSGRAATLGPRVSGDPGLDGHW
jgi:hypothetical protein